MLKYYTFFTAFILTFSATSQNTIIKTQNFDEPNQEWVFATDIPFFDNNSDGFFGIHDGDNDNDSNDTGVALKANTISFLEIKNDFLFINDLSDEGDNGTNNEAVITFSSVDVSNYHQVYISFDYDVVEFDSSDYVKYEIIEDGISTEIVVLPKNDKGSISIPVKNKTQSVFLKLIIKQNGVEDSAGIDNIKLEGKIIDTCSELMISEYVEGTSSVSFRNNFIEIYNPTNTLIDLENYDLVKYTGNNIEISNALNLTGTIPAYGTFLIEDITEKIGVIANLSTNNAVMDFTGDDKIALRNSGQIIDIIGEIGNSIDFAKDITLRRKSNIQNPNNQYDTDEWDMYGLEDLSNINTHVSNCSGAIPEIEIMGNNKSIVDGSEKTSTLDGTYFETVAVDSGSEISKDFYIKNIGDSPLNISNITITNMANFSILTTPNSIIEPLGSTKITISFNPTSLGIKTAMVSIENNDASENPFSFYIQGEGVGESNSPLMITQYYEGSGNNKWIEITNISESETPENYYLALYWNDDAKSPIGIKPSRNKLIPVLLPGQTVKYQSTLTASQPEYAIDGNEIKSSICNFTGDDIIIISTSNDTACWENRLDIIGNSFDWGADKSYVRKYGHDAAVTHTGFNLEDWFIYETSEIDNAKEGTNQRIGNHFIGSTTFTNLNNWDNGIPDKYRDVIIDHDYDTSLEGNLEIYNLSINSGKILNIEADDFISITSDLTVNGVLNVEHEGSLIMVNDNGVVVNHGETKIHKTTTSIKQYDYTYWSSPVKDAVLETVFATSPQNSFYYFETQNYFDADNNDVDDDENAWQPAQGNMELGKGYTAMAPNTNPFIDKQSIIFTGEVNNGKIELPVFLSEDNTNDNDDWNLIGNPYPSAIDAQLFLNNSNNNPVLNGSIYFWTHNTEAASDGETTEYSSDDYAIYTVGTGGVAANSQGEIPTGIIASGQGFFCEAIQQGTIEFNNEMRVKLGNDNFFKSDKKKNNKEQDKIWLNLYNNKGAFSQILIGFIDGATPLYESNFDGLRLKGGSFVSFYSIGENQHLAIQGTQLFHGDEIIPLGFSSKIEKEIILKIGIDHLEGNLKNHDIYLYDHLLHKNHNLKLGDYTFNVESKGIFKDRFSLKFNNTILDLEEINNIDESLMIKNGDEFITLKTNKNSIISFVKIYDMLGRNISEVRVNRTEVVFDNSIFKTIGVYIIHVKLENSNIIIKKIIK